MDTRETSRWLWTSLAVPSVLLAACALVALHEFSEIRAAAKEVERSSERLSDLSRLRIALHEASQPAQTAAPEPDPSGDSTQGASPEQEIESTMARLIRADESAVTRTDLTRLKQAVSGYLAELNRGRTAILQRDAAASRDARQHEAEWLQAVLIALENAESSQIWLRVQNETEVKDEQTELMGALAMTAILVAVLQVWIWLVVREVRRRHSGGERWLRQTNARLEAMVTERTSALAAANQDLTAMSRRLLQLQEEERRALALELHDQVGQQLAAVLLDLRMMESDARKSADHNSLTRMGECIRILEGTYEQIHDLALDLRPLLLDRIGLIPTVQWYASHQERRAGCRITVTADPLPDTLASRVVTASFRIVQEAVNNAIKHAHPDHIDVIIGYQEDCVELSVRDDGRGFDVPGTTANRGHGLGLLGMRERASLAGGSFSIRSRIGVGTEVSARLPLHDHPESLIAATSPALGGAGAG